MDGDRFDALTRALGSGRSRRRVLGAAAAALGALVGRTSEAETRFVCRHASVACARDGDCCSGTCGANASGRRACVCEAPDETMHEGVCLKLRTDLANCGSPGNACPSSTECAEATCAAGVCGATPINELGACERAGGAGAGICSDRGLCIACDDPADYCHGTCGTNAASTFADTCDFISRRCAADGLILSAQCWNSRPARVSTSINVSDCGREDFIISNCEGTLICGAAC
jgi:hypothetical protein